MRTVRGSPGHRAAVGQRLRREGCRLSFSSSTRFGATVWTFCSRPSSLFRQYQQSEANGGDLMVGMARSSSARQLVAGLAAAALAAVLGASVACSEVVLRSVDGGPGYYSQFSNSLPSDLSYFPIGVWFESVTSQVDIDLDKDAGLNLYVVLTTTSDLSLVQKSGMRAILQQSEWRTNQTAINSPAVAGWELRYEIDMQQANEAGAKQARAALNSTLAQLPNDGRMRYNNYGKGVMFWNGGADSEQYVNGFQQVTSTDIYWFTDSNLVSRYEGGALLNNRNPVTLEQVRRAANYGYQVDRMRALDAMDGVRRPIWAFVEVGWPFTGSQGVRAILPAEVRAAVWHSIIAGARGIIYFNHSFGGPNPTQHCLREPAYKAVRAAVKSTNQLITQLAPVLNAPFADGFVSADPSVRTMAKFHDSKYYVFAGSKENKASTPTLSLSGVDNGTATVIGENRTIAISNGRFSDSFADGNAIRIYRIDNQ